MGKLIDKFGWHIEHGFGGEEILEYGKYQEYVYDETDRCPKCKEFPHRCHCDDYWR